MVRFRNKYVLCFAQLVDLKAALFRKQQEYKKEKSSSLRVESSPGSSTVAAAQTAVEKAGRKVSDKVSVRCTRYMCTLYMYVHSLEVAWFCMRILMLSTLVIQTKV